MKKLSLLWGIALTLLLSFSTLHAEDFWQDTLWIRKIPLGGNMFGKIMFHPDGKTIFASSDQFLFQYDVQTGTLVKTRTTHSGIYITDYQLSADNKYFIILTQHSEDMKKGFLEIWDIDTGFVKGIRLSAPPFNKNYTRSLAISPDMKYAYVAYTFPQALEKISLETGEIIKTNDRAGGQISIHPSGNELVSSYTYIEQRSGDQISHTFLLNAENLEIKQYLPRLMGKPTYSPNGLLIGGIGVNKDIILHDIAQETSYSMKGHKELLSDFCFTKEGNFIVSTGYGQGYITWDVISKAKVYEGRYSTGGNALVTLSPDNSIYAKVGQGEGVFVSLWKFKGIINSINENTNINQLSVFPNPTSNTLTIRYPFSNEHSKITISDSKGSVLYSYTINEIDRHRGFIHVESSAYPSGRYICALFTHNNTPPLSIPFIINR